MAKHGSLKAPLNDDKNVHLRREPIAGLPEDRDRQFIDLLEALPAAVYTTDAEGRITFYNQTAADLWGHRPELGRSEWCGSWKLYWPDGTPLPHDECPMAMALKENRPIRGAEAVAERPDGTRVPFIPFPTPLRDRTGRLVGAVNMLIDITREKEVASLRQSEASFRLLFESNPVPMWVYDRNDLRFLAVNDAAVAHYGYSRDCFLSMTILEIRPHEDQEEVRQVAHNIQGKYHAQQSWRHKKANDQEIEVDVYSYPLDFEGREARLVAAIDITERKNAQVRLTYMAHYDQLTNLPNRSLFYQRAEESLVKERLTSILLIDLDNFKSINDSFGHQVGDRLLAAVGSSLSTLVPQPGMVARLGGDEFAILLPGIADPLKVAKLADGIITAFQEPHKIANQRLHVSASIGIAMGPVHGSRADGLLANADLALYKAKEQGGRSYRLFEPSMRAQLAKRERLEAELRHAIDLGEFQLFFQPQVRLRDKQIVGAEALLRWNHPHQGLLSPALFLSVLEKSALADVVGRWTIIEACRTAAKWRDQGFPLMRMGVNLFASQLRDGTLVNLVQKSLRQFKLPPETLELEITENIVLGYTREFLRPLHELRDYGVGLAFDDFGTGFASLSALKTFPLTRLKIDRSFVQGLPSEKHNIAIVKTVLTLGQSIGLDVIAEGVETAEQEAFLTVHGCNEGQGYRYGRPITEAAFSELLPQWLNGKRLKRSRGRQVTYHQDVSSVDMAH